MSGNIPFDIQVEIIKKSHVTSLIKFRSVSKAWKSHIDSSDFIARYRGQQHLLVSYRFPYQAGRRYVLLIDNNTFPEQNVTLTIPPLVKMLQTNRVVGSSHGLLCLYGDYQKGRDGPSSGTGRVVLWNPSIRKAAAIVVPNVHGLYTTTFGFGVCRSTNDPKILKITPYIDKPSDRERVEVFTLSTGAWRSPYTTNCPCKSIIFSSRQVVVDGFLYWLARDIIAMGGRYKLIISFDMTSEEFREINLPGSCVSCYDHDLSLCKLSESLVLLECGVEVNNLVTNVWMMEDGVTKSFSKLFKVIVNTPKAFVRGLRKTAEATEPIIEIVESHNGFVYSSLHVVSEPYSKHINSLGISGCDGFSSVYPYMETLLLIDQPDLIIYDKGKHYISK